MQFQVKFKAVVFLLFGAFMALALAGCSKNTVKENPVILKQNHYIVESSLQQAAKNTASSLQQLAALTKAHQGKFTMPFEHLKNAGLSRDISVRWYGPITPFLKKVASKVGYKLQIYGKAPHTPVLINVDNSSHMTSALEILRNVDLQAGLNANVRIYPKQKIISLRYT